MWAYRVKILSSVAYISADILITMIIIFVLFLSSCSEPNTSPVNNVHPKGENMSSTESIQITETIGAERSPYTPQIPEDQFVIKFTAKPAVSEDGPTVALFIAYRLGQPYLAMYGGELKNAINIVAIHVDSGRVYFAPPVGENAISLSLTMKDEKDIGSTENLASATSSFFDVDLCRLLALHPEGGSYHVFLWMDDMTSLVQTLQVPANPSRPAEDSLSTQLPSEIIEFGDFPVPLIPPGNKIALTQSTQPGDRTIYGAWSPDPANIASQRAKDAPYYLTLLAFNHRDRRFGWVSVDVTQLPPSTDSSKFRIDPLKIVGASDMRQKIFTLAVSGEVMSKVLVGRLE